MLQSNKSISYFKDIDILYEGANLFKSFNKELYHDSFRIIFFDNAQGILYYEGKKIPINQNMAVVIRPYVIYSLYSNDSTIKFFDFNFLDKKSTYNINELFNIEYLIDLTNDIFFKQCFDKALIESNEENGSKILLQSGIGFCLLSTIFRNMKNIDSVEIDKKEVSRSNIFLLSEIESKLEENFVDNSIISNLAYEVGISENKLYKVIKDTYGLSPKQWILEKKIKRIKIMLVERYTYHEISEKLAFCSISHMSSTFKKYVGCTPNEYLKNYANK
ncbi:MAG: AraC family transcriptional regulator [Erysipelotrichales bacterium]